LRADDRIVMPIASIRGHREIAMRLLSELHSRPSHAYLFAGPRGVGKALIANSLVHALMCERSAGENFCCTTARCPVRLAPQTERTRARAADADTPRCDCCSTCVQIATGVHPDFTYVSRPVGRSEVLIDQVRELIVRLGIRPSRSSLRMAVIDDAETLGVPAQNALLKTLEEPPGHAIIIMVTASERALLDTVRSRMRTVRFPALQTADLEAILAAHGVADQARARALALLARGSAANAIALAEGDEPPMKELLDALGKAKSIDFARAQSLAQEFFANREAAAGNFELLARLLEEILCYKLLKTDFVAFGPESRSKMASLADSAEVDALVKCIDAAVRASEAVGENANPRLQAENWWTIAGHAMRGE
jgi:DNA polymerase III subunit delta'